jgi:phage terminase large subunit-like protein
MLQPMTRPLGNPIASLSPENRQLVELYLRRKMRRIRQNPLRHLARPHAGQELLLASSHPHILLIAANRWGKTLAAIWEVLWRATNTHPYKQLRPHQTIWCGYPDHKFFIRVTKRIFDAWIPKEYLIDEGKSDRRYTFRRRGGGSCDVFFLSYDQQLDSWAGGSVDHVWLDESCPQDISKEASARVIDRSGSIHRTFTPVPGSGIGWTYDEIYLPAKEGRRNVQVIEGALAEEDETKPASVGRVLVPHLTYDQVLRLAQEYPDPADRTARVFGRYSQRTGLVYRDMDPKIHVIDSFDIPDHWDIWGGIDPGFHGFAATWLTASPEGATPAVAEYFSSGRSIGERFEEMKRILQTIRPFSRIRDAIPMYVDTEDPQTVLELNLQASEQNIPMVFVSLKMGLKARFAGFTRIQSMLRPRLTRPTPDWIERPRPVVGEPSAYFFDSLLSRFRDNEGRLIEGSRLLWEMKRYEWKVDKDDRPRDDADENSAGGAHALAAYRYAIMARWGPLEEEHQGDAADLPETLQRIREVQEHADPVLHRMMKEAEERMREEMELNEEEEEWNS